MTSSQLEQAFASRGVHRYGAVYFDAANATALLLQAREAGIGILGIDCVQLTPDATIPSDIADYSTDPSAWSAALAFVESRATTGLLFELVLA